MVHHKSQKQPGFVFLIGGIAAEIVVAVYVGGAEYLLPSVWAESVHGYLLAGSVALQLGGVGALLAGVSRPNRSSGTPTPTESDSRRIQETRGRTLARTVLQIAAGLFALVGLVTGFMVVADYNNYPGSELAPLNTWLFFISSLICWLAANKTLVALSGVDQGSV